MDPDYTSESAQKAAAYAQVARHGGMNQGYASPGAAPAPQAPLSPRLDDLENGAGRLYEILSSIEGRLFGFNPPNETANGQLASVPTPGVGPSIDRLGQTLRRATNLASNILDRL